jgi:FMN phosphatase YigB (HAD superfamily)
VIAGEIAVRTGLSQTSAHEVLRDFNAHWEINGLLIGGLAELRPRWKVGLLANAGDAALFAIEERLGVELADDVVVSSHVGLAKPDVEIYRLAASRLRVDPRRCVFIDDRQDNVDGAVEAGMTAIRHVSTERTLGELVALRSS